MKLVIRPYVERDLDAAATWYEERRPGLREDFVEEVGAALYRIQGNPRLYPVIHLDIHRAPVRRFPFGVFYALVAMRSTCSPSFTTPGIPLSGAVVGSRAIKEIQQRWGAKLRHRIQPRSVSATLRRWGRHRPDPPRPGRPRLLRVPVHETVTRENPRHGAAPDRALTRQAPDDR